MFRRILFCWLLLSAPFAKTEISAQTILLQDSFDLASENPNSLNVNFDTAHRQSGLLAPITYTKGLDGTFSQVGNPGVTNALLLAGRAGGSGGALSLDHDFIEAAGFGRSSIIQFDVNPVLLVAGVNQSPTSWVAITFGSSTASRNQFPQFADGAAILFRGSGWFQAFNAGKDAGHGPYIAHADHVFHRVRITLTEPVRGDAFAGNLPVLVNAFVDDNAVPLVSFVRTNGFAHNYISLIGEGEGSGGDGVARHLVDNLIISLEPAAEPALGLAVTGESAILSWPAFAAHYHAYAASSLVPPIEWALVPGPIVNQGTEFTLTVPLSGSNYFFRLKQ